MTKIARNKRRTTTVMANGGEWSPVTIIQEGVKRLSLADQMVVTLEDAMNLYYKHGLAVTTA